MQRFVAVAAVGLLFLVQRPARAGDAPAPAPAPAPAAAPAGKPMTCTTGELWAGNPTHSDPAMRPKEGQGLRDDPPLGFRSLLFSGPILFTTVGQEIWMTDTSAAKPIIKRVAGKEQNGQQWKGGPCKEARFANIFGITRLSDGSIVGADQTANGLFRMTDPAGPKCTVELLAGAKTQESVSPSRPPNTGDVDGTGFNVKLSLPIWPTAGDKDTVYFIDSNVGKLKSLANDAAHTVKTVAKLPEGVYHATTFLNGKVYALANNFRSEAFIVEVDPANGQIREVVRGNADTFEAISASINPSGLTTDGKGLIMWHSGIILYVDAAEGTVTRLAGTGDYFNYKGSYDPLVPHKASELQLVASRRHMTAGTSTFLAWQPGAIYMSNSNTNAYVEKISCE